MERHYSEWRLTLPYSGRFALRFLTYGGGACLVAAGLILSFSEIWPLRAVSLLILISFLFYLLTIGLPWQSLKKVSDAERNVAIYTAPETYKILEIALDRTALDHSYFSLNVLAELLKSIDCSKKLSALGIEPAEFSAKVESRRKRLISEHSKAETLAVINKLMVAAFEEAQAAQAKAIRPSHLLRALLKSGLPEIVTTFEIFGRTPADMLD